MIGLLERGWVWKHLWHSGDNLKVLLLKGWCQYKRMGYGKGTGALISKTEIKTTCPEIWIFKLEEILFR